jgi:hypothetical protein
MERIMFSHRREDGAIVHVEYVECPITDWERMPESASNEWSVCKPEPNGADNLVRATRLSRLDAASREPGIFRVVGGA